MWNMGHHKNRTKLLLLTLFAVVSLLGCGIADPDDAFEPLPPPNELPPKIIDPYYLDEDSLVALIPDLSIRQTGVTSGGFMKMDIEIAVDILNDGQQSYVFAPGRATVYTPVLPNFLEVGTAELLPVTSKGTQSEETVSPGDRKVLFYDNNPIDELAYRPEDVEFFAVFLLVINGEEQLFVSNLTTF
jgi:hypothetical protein